MGKILIVDDEIDICLLLSSILEREGFSPSYSLSIRDAKTKLALIEDVDLVFLDLNLSDGVGYQLIPEIKQLEGEVKIVVVSAYDSEAKKAIMEGADYFIPKPFNRETILEALNLLKIK